MVCLATIDKDRLFFQKTDTFTQRQEYLAGLQTQAGGLPDAAAVAGVLLDAAPRGQAAEAGSRAEERGRLQEASAGGDPAGEEKTALSSVILREIRLELFSAYKSESIDCVTRTLFLSHLARPGRRHGPVPHRPLEGDPRRRGLAAGAGGLRGLRSGAAHHQQPGLLRRRRRDQQRLRRHRVDVDAIGAAAATASRSAADTRSVFAEEGERKWELWSERRLQR